MERIYHIKETALPNNNEIGESDAVRDKINQESEYDSTSETHSEQIKVREYLNSFNEAALQEIFSEYYRKAGSDESLINWIPFAKVRISYLTAEEQKKQNSPYGGYSISRGVNLWSHLLCNDPELTLWTLIHEECHAISQDLAFKYPDRNEDGVEVGLVSQLSSGVAIDVLSVKYDSDVVESDSFNEGINEGITELLTERIFREYKRRLGLETYSQHLIYPGVKISDTEQTVAREKFNVYERNWQNAKLYIGIISAISDIPENVVEEAVIRTYIRNGCIRPDVIDPEVKEILDELHPALGQYLFSILESKKYKSQSLKAYVDEINRLDIPEELKQKINIVLQKIKEEWGEAFKLAPDEI